MIDPRISVCDCWIRPPVPRRFRLVARNAAEREADRRAHAEAQRELRRMEDAR